MELPQQARSQMEFGNEEEYKADYASYKKQGFSDDQAKRAATAEYESEHNDFPDKSEVK